MAEQPLAQFAGEVPGHDQTLALITEIESSLPEAKDPTQIAARRAVLGMLGSIGALLPLLHTTDISEQKGLDQQTAWPVNTTIIEGDEVPGTGEALPKLLPLPSAHGLFTRGLSLATPNDITPERSPYKAGSRSYLADKINKQAGRQVFDSEQVDDGTWDAIFELYSLNNVRRRTPKGQKRIEANIEALQHWALGKSPQQIERILTIKYQTSPSVSAIKQIPASVAGVVGRIFRGNEEQPLDLLASLQVAESNLQADLDAQAQTPEDQSAAADATPAIINSVSSVNIAAPEAKIKEDDLLAVLQEKFNLSGAQYQALRSLLDPTLRTTDITPAKEQVAEALRQYVTKNFGDLNNIPEILPNQVHRLRLLIGLFKDHTGKSQIRPPVSLATQVHSLHIQSPDLPSSKVIDQLYSGLWLMLHAEGTQDLSGAADETLPTVESEVSENVTENSQIEPKTVTTPEAIYENPLQTELLKWRSRLSPEELNLLTRHLSSNQAPFVDRTKPAYRSFRLICEKLNRMSVSAVKNRHRDNLEPIPSDLIQLQRTLFGSMDEGREPVHISIIIAKAKEVGLKPSDLESNVTTLLGILRAPSHRIASRPRV